MTNRYAYVYLVMKGDKYVPGVLVSAYSLLIHKPKADIVCMVTNDVSVKSIIKLQKVCTKVVEVPYLEFLSTAIESEKYIERYGSWISVSYTKMYCMTLIEYDKILFLDADTIILQNIDKVFDYKTPAGVFVNSKSTIYKKFTQSVPWEFIKIVIDNPKKCNFVPPADVFLIKPKLKDFEDYVKMMNRLTKNNSLPYGDSMMSGQDEQSMATFYSIVKKKNWSILPGSMTIEERRIRKIMPIVDGKITTGYILQFTAQYNGVEKPWERFNSKYNDVNIWWQFAYDLKTLIPNIFDGLIDRKYIKKINTACPYCKIIEGSFPKSYWRKTDINHKFIDKSVIICPRITDYDGTL